MSITLNKFTNLEDTNKGRPIYMFGGDRWWQNKGEQYNIDLKNSLM